MGKEKKTFQGLMRCSCFRGWRRGAHRAVAGGERGGKEEKASSIMVVGKTADVSRPEELIFLPFARGKRESPDYAGKGGGRGPRRSSRPPGFTRITPIRKEGVTLTRERRPLR